MFTVTFADGFSVRVTGNITVAELMEHKQAHGSVTSLEPYREPRAFDMSRVEGCDVVTGGGETFGKRAARAFSIDRLDA